MLTASEEHALLAVARRSFDARVRRLPAPVAGDESPAEPCYGAFVTIHRDDDLRGCLGWLDADRPLAEVVAHLAGAVADADPRFDPVRVSELPAITIEISVLTPAREVSALSDIEVGRHGLIVEQGGRTGLLLPQVASEHAWDAATFVEHTCRKAGLPTDAWQRGARVSVFEAQVFNEDGTGAAAVETVD